MACENLGIKEYSTQSKGGHETIILGVIHIPQIL